MEGSSGGKEKEWRRKERRILISKNRDDSGDGEEQNKRGIEKEELIKIQIP